MLKESFIEAINLLLSLDKELLIIVFTTFKIVMISTVLASFISIPLAFSITIMHTKIRKILIAFFNSLLAVPTVVIGLFVYMMISKSGPFGFYDILFTPWAIVIGQTILAVPIITSFILAGLSKTDVLLHETIITLGGNKIDLVKVLIMEHKALLISSVLAGFGRVIAEVGISMMLGGNIRWFTRTMTTAIALETGKGEFALGLALGLILMTIALFINFSVHYALKTDNVLRTA